MRIKVETAKLIFKNRSRARTRIGFRPQLWPQLCEWSSVRGGGWMRVLTWSGTVCLVVSLLACAVGFGSVGTGLLATAQAQTVPKSLEEGGTDAAMRVRKNNWSVGIAGGQRTGTYMTFADELAQVLDDGDNLRV